MLFFSPSLKVSTFPMALVVMCGQPCSGKSEAAACLTAALRSSMADITVRVIDESSLHLGRNASYKGIYRFLVSMFLYATIHICSSSTIAQFFLPIYCVNFLDMVVEKNLRGVLRSEVDRSVSRDSIIIVDSLNNIKVMPVPSP
jgi:protein KTI12